MGVQEDADVGEVVVVVDDVLEVGEGFAALVFRGVRAGDGGVVDCVDKVTPSGEWSVGVQAGWPMRGQGVFVAGSGR